MEKTGFTLVVILVITAIFFSGCTSPASVQSPAISTTDSSFNHLLLSSEDLPLGLVRAADGPMQPSYITGTMRNFGLIKGYRVLYADAIPLTDRSKVMEQDILVFPGTNASAMLDEHKKSFTAIQSQNIVALPLPDPNLGERSFALKISSVGPSGAETHHYVFGFVQSGMYEVISMEGTPETYPALVHIAERAAAKAR
ncbi:MAG: hypothetical protein Q8R70_11100 [Methanoregula sp.]|nr:hypothetical protein [Methanoregula sp.]